MSRTSFRTNRKPGRKVEHILLVILGTCFVLLTLRLYTLQVLEGAQHQKQSDRNRVRVMTLKAPRGLVLDRNSEILIDNRRSYSLLVVPFEVTESTLEGLETLLNVDGAAIREKIRHCRLAPFKPVKILDDIDFSQLSRIEEHLLELPGVILQIEPRRKYTLGRYGSHLLGYVGEISTGELEELFKQGYKAGDLIGRQGIEKQYESYLRGVDGVQYREIDAFGREIGPLEQVSDVPFQTGNNVYLTIDAELQRVAEEAMGDSLNGGLVAIDPRNGEVLALVSHPNYDPRLLSDGISKELWQRLNQDPRHPLLNRALCGVYPPGSTLKVVAAAAALEEQVLSPERPLEPCRGGYQFGRRFFHCWKEQGHGRLDLAGALIQSCDTFFYQVGIALGLDRWSSYAKKFGLGTPTGIDLSPELSGLVPTRAYYDNSFGAGKWSKALILNLAIGQGETLVTPLQMAVLTAAIGNSGRLYRPRLLARVEAPDGQLLLDQQPQLKATLDLAPETLAQIDTILQRVVNEPGGTGSRARVRGYTVAGKTGTAQNAHGEDHAWFIAYAPAEAPTIALAVIRENAGGGGAMAAPVARTVIEAHLAHRHIPLVSVGSGGQNMTR